MKNPKSKWNLTDDNHRNNIRAAATQSSHQCAYHISETMIFTYEYNVPHRCKKCKNTLRKRAYQQTHTLTKQQLTLKQ